MSFREEIKEMTGENRQNPKLGFPQVVLLKKKIKRPCWGWGGSCNFEVLVLLMDGSCNNSLNPGL